MKDQYFGDQRDYCKFDLVIELATSLYPKPRFTNIAMLTPNDGTAHGGEIAYEMGKRDPTLFAFLQHHAHLPRGRRKVPSLRKYFATKRTDVEYLPYGDAPPHFNGNSRDEYFANVPEEWLKDAVILADPDIGLCPASGRRTSVRHLLFGEALDLVGRMGPSSVLVVFQWRGRLRWQTRLDSTQETLRQQNGDGHFDAVHDLSLAFLCLANDPVTRAKVQGRLRGYAGEHGLSYATR